MRGEIEKWVRDCDECGDKSKCHEPTKIWDQSFPWCPFALLSTPRWQAVVGAYNMIQVQPMAGWPNDWSAWVVSGVTAIAHHQSAKLASEVAKNGQ